MRNVMLGFAACVVASLLVGCSMFGGGCSTGCDPDPCCQPVYKSPCCPAPDQGMGYDGSADSSSCGGGSCGGGADAGAGAS